jgi:DNA polymerase III alpha subunit
LQALVGGANSRLILHRRDDERRQAIRATRDLQLLFGDRLSLAVDFPTSSRARLELERTADLGKLVGVPLVATPDIRYLHQEDADAYGVYRRLSANRTDSNDREQLTEAKCLRSLAEMISAFALHPEAVSRAGQISSQIDPNLGLLESARRAGHRSDFHLQVTDVAAVKGRLRAGEVARFTTISRHRSRPLVSVVGSLLGLPEESVTAVLQSVSTWMRPSIGQIIRENTELQSLYCRDDGVRRLLNVIARLERTVRERFVGSGDFVLSEVPLLDLMPTFGQWQDDDLSVLQWTRDDLQWLGFETFSARMASQS